MGKLGEQKGGVWPSGAPSVGTMWAWEGRMGHRGASGAPQRSMGKLDGSEECVWCFPDRHFEGVRSECGIASREDEQHKGSLRVTSGGGRKLTQKAMLQNCCGLTGHLVGSKDVKATQYPPYSL